jgi:hypothetical protein
MEKYLEPKDVIFDNNCEFYVSFNNLNDKIGVKLIEKSNYSIEKLNYSKEDLSEKNKIEICYFINNFDVWNEISIKAILNWADNNFDTKLKTETIKLSHIYLLFDKDNDNYYGLLYNLDIDDTYNYKRLLKYNNYINSGIGVEIYGDTFNVNIITSGDELFW